MIQANALHIPLKDESVQCVVTSPAYWGLRDYSVNGQLGLEKTPEEYVENTVKWAREVWRVLRKDGTFWLNLGDSYWGGKGQNGQADAEYHSKRNSLSGKAHLNFAGNGKMKPQDGKHKILKPKDLCGIPFKVAFALQADGWWLRSAMPWVKRCLSGGTMIHARTQKGVIPTNLKDLYRLKPETVKLWNGERWTQLKGMTKQPRKGSEIEIFLRSGERISCTQEHRWPVGNDLKYSNQLRVGDILKRCRPASPLKVINYLPSQSIGRFIGLYIAEGCRDDDVIHISGHKKEKDRRIFLRNIAAKYDGTMAVQDREGNGQNINLSGRVLFGILDDYVAGKGAHGKHLTTKAWQRGNLFLRCVLLGYLEGDGHYDKKNDRWRLGFCNNDQWVSDLRSICARLGVSLRLKRTVHKNQTGKFKGYKGELRFDLSDKSMNSTNFKKLSDNEIVKIGKPRARYYYDVEVKDEPHLFSLASGILTHNSAMPESCTDRPASALEYMFLLTKSSKYYFDMDAIRQPHVDFREGKNVPKAIKQTDSPDALKKHWNAKENKYNPAGRNFRNTDLFYQSLEEPHGAILAGEEMVGLDVNPQAYSEAHFATFPDWLVTPLIKAGSSEKGACPKCKSPWERILSKSEGGTTGKSWQPHIDDKITGNSGGNHGQKMFDSYVPSKTIGWQPTCKCGHKETVPCIVLDNFGGSGTTKNVADRLGRRGVMCELKMEYIEMARKRCYRAPDLF